MTQPMLALKSDKTPEGTPKATPHLLPCRVHHNGPVEPAQSFWNPKTSEGKNWPKSPLPLQPGTLLTFHP